MQISLNTSSTALVQQGSDKMAGIKQAFQSLESALQSGDLAAAKDAYAQLQKNAPPSRSGDQGNNPMQQKMDALGKALDSGDLEAARSAYADIKSAMAQRPAPAGGQGGRPAGGPMPGGGGQAVSASNSVTYDPKDTNKDGTVSAQEELMYSLSQATADTENTAGNQVHIDALA